MTIDLNTQTFNGAYYNGQPLDAVYAGNLKVFPALTPVHINYISFLLADNFVTQPSVTSTTIGWYQLMPYVQNPTFEYSYDNTNWNEWDLSNLVLNAGQTLYFRGKNEFGFGGRFTCGDSNANLILDGNVQALLDFETLQMETKNMFNLFYGMPIISVNSDFLPATALTNGCYEEMFAGCTKLTNAPELPATTLVQECYAYMFSGCTSLTGAPELPATTLVDYCYASMFNGCSNLNHIKCFATSITAEGCTDDWTSSISPNGTFTKAQGVEWTAGDSGIPDGWTVNEDGVEKAYISFTNGGTESCEIGFEYASPTFEYSYDNTNWNEWDLSSLELNTGQTLYFRGINTAGTGEGSFACYGGNNLILDGNVQALVDYRTLPMAAAQMSYLFYGMPLISVNSDFLPATALTDYCYGLMFCGCPNLTTAPELPATTLAKGCYATMFQDCTSLTVAPELPATTLVSDCYKYMFQGCTSLNYIKCLATNPNNSFTSDWIKRVQLNTGTFVKAQGVEWPYDYDYSIPIGWTIINL